MSNATRALIVMAMVALAVSLTVSVAYAHKLQKGTATFYTAPYVPSACNGDSDEGVMIAAASDAIWDDGKACGRHYKVTCTGSTNDTPHPCKGKHVVVKIVDYCPQGCAGTIDLSQEAFAKIANPDAGKIKIKFKQV